MEAVIKPTINKYAIGQVVKSHREVRGMTQEQLANEFGWNKQIISDIESGKSVTLEKLMLISTFLCFSIDAIRPIAVK